MTEEQNGPVLAFDQGKVYPKGKPVSVADLMAIADSKEKYKYTRIPGFKPGQVFVIVSLMSDDFIEWSEANEGPAKRTAGLRLIIKSVVDGEPDVDEGATGKQIMDDTHIALLRKIPHETTENVVRGIVKHNGMRVPGADVKND